MILIGKVIKSGLFLNDKLRNAKKIGISQERTLLKLLKNAEKTEFGRLYGFSEILKSENPEQRFQESVPVFDYDSIYEKWWKRALDGDKDVAWPGKIKYFALSSGTSGSSSKRIPVSSEMISAIRKAGIHHLSSVRKHPADKNIYAHHILLLGGSTELDKAPTHSAGDLSGILTANLPIWLNFIYKPGPIISKEKDWNSKIEKMVLKADKWDVGIISGVPAWVQLLIEKVIEHYKLNNIHELWPNFSVYSHGGVSIKPYKERFDKLLGDKVMFLETYLASEGFIAFEQKAGLGMEILLGNGIYYEFIPFDENHFDANGSIISTEGIVNYHDVVEGVVYALLISTCSGTWRYLIGDTVKFINERIIITGRTKHFISLCGEHLSIDNMNDAIRKATVELKKDIREYTVVGQVYKHGFMHKWYISAEDSEIPADVFEKLIDEELKNRNDDYKTERKSMLVKVKVIPVPLELFYSWMERENRIGGQTKFPRVLTEKQLISWENHLKMNNIDTEID